MAPLLDAGRPERVRLAKPLRIKCSASARARGQEGDLCDGLPSLEEALAKAIRENADCAPREREDGNINYVLVADFTQRHVHVFPGKSGKWRGKKAKRAAQCVQRALPASQWDAVQHQYRYYMIAVQATYPVLASGQPAADAGSEFE